MRSGAHNHLDGPVPQVVLPLGTLLMMTHLPHRRLPDIDVGRLLQVVALDFQHRQHHPRSRSRRELDGSSCALVAAAARSDAIQHCSMFAANRPAVWTSTGTAAALCTQSIGSRRRSSSRLIAATSSSTCRVRR